MIKLLPKKIKYLILKYYQQFIVKILGEYSFGILIRNNDLVLAVSPSDMSVGRELRNNGSYSNDEVERLKALITDQSKVVILGGHIGSVAIQLAKKCNEIHVFEANPETFILLDYNFTLNKFNNSKLYNLAVGEDNGFIDFVCSKTFSVGAKRYPKLHSEIYLWDNPLIKRVEMVPLDKFNDISSSTIDLMLVDIEGSEVFALKGAQQTLKFVMNLVIEFIPHHLKNISNSNVHELCDLISPHFDHFKLSKSDHIYSISQCYGVLGEMYDLNLADEGILFFKNPKQNSF